MSYKTFQFRAYATKAGYTRIDRLLLLSAILYNAALEERVSAYRNKGLSISRFDQFKSLTQVRRDDPQNFGSVAVAVFRGPLVRLDRAMKRFFERVKNGEKPGFPRFKSSRRWHTLELSHVSTSVLKTNHANTVVKIKGLPSIWIRETALPKVERLKSLSVTRKSRRLYVNLTYEIEPERLASTGKVVGIDLGVSERLVCSDGQVYARHHGNDDAVKKVQRRMARCKKGSRRYRQLRGVLVNLHQRERVRNRNVCLRITTEVVKTNDVIVMEDLKIQNMTATAKGTKEAPGVKVRQKSGLNREVRKQTWGILQTQIAYKAANAGRQVVKVDPRYSSQSCSKCSVVEASSREGKRYCCKSCGHQMDADLNASINILTKGLAAIPGGNVPGAVAIAA